MSQVARIDFGRSVEMAWDNHTFVVQHDDGRQFKVPRNSPAGVSETERRKGIGDSLQLLTWP
ncbi:hypothetical protein E2C01_069348 [Portunus trituberculatus]|uniref:Uncharacterized protein n=1 Tax=Portunus trituberculatus TaxID=210409 RepID=A0A5B7HYN1_PORTR|nr:hypothetical protein [Portunus trituberculatus]